MDWVISILRGVTGFEFVEGLHLERIGHVSLLDGRLQSAVIELPDDEVSFLGSALRDYLTSSGRMPQIAAATHLQFGGEI